MPQIIIEVHSKPVVRATTVWEDDLTLEATTDEASVKTGNRPNDGNTTETFKIAVSNIVNGTLKAIILDDPNTGGTKVVQAAEATIKCPPGQSVGATIVFDVDPGAPGEPDEVCTAEYTAGWV